MEHRPLPNAFNRLDALPPQVRRQPPGGRAHWARPPSPAWGRDAADGLADDVANAAAHRFHFGEFRHGAAPGRVREWVEGRSGGVEATIAGRR